MTAEEKNVAICEWLGYEVLKSSLNCINPMGRIQGQDWSCLPSHFTGPEALQNCQDAIRKMHCDKWFKVASKLRLLADLKAIPVILIPASDWAEAIYTVITETK